ncbi:hypothetical protein GR268_36350 [Rhizobium leguminosarum]|nr:hypothetical protein [Rhizobium leguminosarum]
MPHEGKNYPGKSADVDQIEETTRDKETLSDALSKAGFEPAKVGRKIVSQGKRRESLKKRVFKAPCS